MYIVIIPVSKFYSVPCEVGYLFSFDAASGKCGGEAQSLQNWHKLMWPPCS